MENKTFSSKNIATIAILSALIVVIQLITGFIKIGVVNLSFVLIPIVVGAIALSPLCGMILGIVFGFVCFFMGLFGLDGFTYYLISQSPFITFMTCVIKGAAAGYFSGLIFKFVSKKNDLIASILASISAPILNTGLFIVGALIMKDTISSFLSAMFLFASSRSPCTEMPCAIACIVTA